MSHATKAAAKKADKEMGAALLPLSEFISQLLTEDTPESVSQAKRLLTARQTINTVIYECMK